VGLQHLLVEMNVKGNGQWDECFDVQDVTLPTGYFFGASASTGDLADNHDIISIQVEDAPEPTEEFEAKMAEYKTGNPVGSMAAAKKAAEEMKHHLDKANIVSNHGHDQENARQGSDGPRMQQKADDGIGVLTILLIVCAVCGVGYGAFVFTQKKKNDPSKFSF